MSRRAIKIESTPLGTLAANLFCAQDSLLYAERQLEDLLDSLYGRSEWMDFEFDSVERAIDVYGAVESEAALDCLFRVGFARVTQHQHGPNEFKHCGCRQKRIH